MEEFPSESKALREWVRQTIADSFRQGALFSLDFIMLELAPKLDLHSKVDEVILRSAILGLKERIQNHPIWPTS